MISVMVICVSFVPHATLVNVSQSIGRDVSDLEIKAWNAAQRDGIFRVMQLQIQKITKLAVQSHF
ncbi:hypothetical protein AYW79_00610 [Ferroacidibacillus organovorans]|uniref:Uncharacterized protein n=1 Tax=Ferroacidibacillus organovorans TaxID=1765683 RepID=A0A162SN44_9BACL|nr:hypothetical protein AYJ22_12955 [Ferroacidibacillus organovorans]OAG95444.1 hypothetical protein AYW79_00610 [Ferroacidibacillus organovorans]OPG17550.1 hypothetical protein B2M26_00885 [Ferroacidibacillus organovorans]